MKAVASGLAVLLVVALPGALSPHARSASPALHKQSRLLMGTACDIQVYDADEDRARVAAGAALDAMQHVDDTLSNYKAESELSAMNRSAARAPFRASRELFDFVLACRRFHALTLGAFDPTVGPLVSAWGFDTAHPARPSDARIADAGRRSGFDKVMIDEAARTIAFAADGMAIDPGGIGKGWAADRAAEELRRRGVVSALVSAGGSTLVAIGAPPDRDGWTVAVRNALDPAVPHAYVTLRDTSLSTSGVSQRAVVVAGRRYGHLFDPRTGVPAGGVCQVTVVAPTGTASDALAKAAFVLDRGDVVRTFASQPGSHALRIDGDCDGPSARWTTPGADAVFAAAPPAR